MKKKNVIGVITFISSIALFTIFGYYAPKAEESNDCVINETYVEDCIATYKTFSDVPAGSDSIIKVNDILYIKGDTEWVVFYIDEDVMWVDKEGNTFYE